MKQSKTKRKSTDSPEVDGWELLAGHMEFYGRVMGRAEARLKPWKLEVKSFFLLTALEYSGHPAELSRYLLIPKPTVTYLIKRLESLGYVSRKGVAGDLRKFEIVLTAKGKKAAEQSKEVVTRAMQESVAILNTQEQRTYCALVEKLRNMKDPAR